MVQPPAVVQRARIRHAGLGALRHRRADPGGASGEAGRDQSIWLQRAVGPEGKQWLVLGPEGSRLYEIEFPPDVRVQQATVNRAWATRVGDLDVPYVIGYVLKTN